MVRARPIRDRILVASVVAASILATLGSAETALRIYFLFRTSYDMEMWHYAVQMKQEVPDRRSHIHIPGAVGHLMHVDVSINSKGFRDTEYPYERTPGRYRMLALGDSVVFGWGVLPEQSVSKDIERELNAGAASRFEVLNMGVGNYNAEQVLETYIKEGTRYSPDSALYFIHISDIEPTQKHSLNPIALHSYLYAFLVQRFNQLRPLLDRRNDYRNFYQRLYESESWNRYVPILDELVSEARKHHTRLIIAVLPEFRSLENYPFHLYHERIGSYFKAAGVDVIDLLAPFAGKKSADLMVAKDDPHPNAKAHAIIAASVVRELKERHLIP